MVSRSPSLMDSDELLHRPDERQKWRESYYFNWVDAENNVSGFTTIGILPNEKRREFVFLLFVDDKMEVHYQEPPLETYVDDINKMLTDNILTYQLVKPFQTWKILYTTPKLEFKLRWETRFPTYDFGRDSSASWHGHFEASGKVNGTIKYSDGTKRSFKGYGQRDKSWGYRDWHQFDKWYATHIQFQDWSCAFRKDHTGSRIDLSGSMSTKKGNTPLARVEIETINDNDQFQTPLTSTYYITDIKGNSYTVKSKLLGKNTYLRFARNFQGGYTELFEQMVIMECKETGEVGTGMTEYLRTIKTK
ncbi:MAG: hypothetical protein KIH10_07690 [Candidatus Freyarchaeota archaeon]|nr:hypothetical protein [Candidatus Jordarchaeia archaeon]